MHNNVHIVNTTITGHLKMVSMANFMLYTFDYNKNDFGDDYITVNILKMFELYIISG